MTTPTIRVTDPNGRMLSPTWRKRADGLVKKGRAYYTAEDHIVLTFTPSDGIAQTEENTMSNENINTPTQPTDSMLTVDYLLTQLEKITADTAYLTAAIEAIKSIGTGNPGDIAGQGKATALGDAVKCRETTNQQLISLYTKLLDGLTAERIPTPKAAALDIMMTVVKDGALSADEKITMLEKVSDNLETVRFLSE